MPIAFDTAGFRQHDQSTWVDPATGDQVELTYFDLVPDLPAPLEDVPKLRHDLAVLTGEVGCLVEAQVVRLGDVPALLQVVKLPIPDQPAGQVFIGSFTVPRANSSAVLKFQAIEQGTTGVREAVLLAEVGFDRWARPHPYAPEVEGRLPFHAGDDPRYDHRFGDHPLSRVRAWLHHVVRTARVDPRFAALPPFTPRPAGHPPAEHPPAAEARPTPAQHAASQHAQAEYPPAQRGQAEFPPAQHGQAEYPPAQHAQAEYPPAQHGQAEFPPAQHAQAEYPPAQHGQAEFPPAQHAQAEYPPAQHGQAEYPPAQHAQAEYPPDQHSRAHDPPAQRAAAQYQPAEPPPVAPVDPVDPAFTGPAPARPAHAPRAPEVGSVLTTVVPGIPIGGHLPLWIDDECTFWRMTDPEAVLEALGLGALARAPLAEGRFRDVLMLDESSGTVLLPARYRSDDGGMASGMAALVRVSGQDAHEAMTSDAVLEAFRWVGRVSAAAAERGEYVVLEPGYHTGELREPHVLMVVREHGGRPISVVETAPTPPADLPMWNGRSSLNGPATREVVEAGGILAMYAMDGWGEHPLRLCLTFGPVPEPEST